MSPDFDSYRAAREFERMFPHAFDPRPECMGWGELCDYLGSDPIEYRQETSPEGEELICTITYDHTKHTVTYEWPDGRKIVEP